jgi:NDP-sugar pyrophosphorylase family protein
MRIDRMAPGEVGLAEDRAAAAPTRIASEPRPSEVRTGIQGIVLAGVYPDARSPLDRLLPRPLLPVMQQPLISHVLRWLGAEGVPRSMICTNQASRGVRSGLEAVGLDMQLGYVEDGSPRGPAGCVRDAGLLSDANTFIVADATSIPLADVGSLLATHRAMGAAVTVCVTEDALGRLRPCDIYVFDRRAFAYIPADGFQDIKERLLPALHKGGERVALSVTRTTAPRVVNARSYIALDQWALARAAAQGTVPSGFRRTGDALVHESAAVHPEARLLGPVMVGPDVTIERGAIVVGPTDIGAATRIGEGALVSRTVAWRDSIIGRNAFVDRSLLPQGTVVGDRESAISIFK